MGIWLRLGCGAALLAATAAAANPYIVVDQFGYRPGDAKIAVIADPQEGFNAADSFEPGSFYQVRRRDGDEVVYSGAPSPWEEGRTHAQSGDRGWRFDFSQVRQAGSYYVHDPANDVSSHPFDIDPQVYEPVLRAAVRMFFYNRSGMAKEPPFADSRWADGPSFEGPGQDTEARPIYDRGNAALARDVSGGWFDAGDFNKYVTFAEAPVHQLLDAYEQNPGVWTDDFGIPESGNGLPDLLDEVLWQIEWLKKMQDGVDGGVHIKAGSVTFDLGSPPSSDTAPRFFGPKCSSSTVAAAGMFAHAARVLEAFPARRDYAADLKRRAGFAWDWFGANPVRDDCDTQEIKAGDADRDAATQRSMAVTAAVYLFAATGEGRYGDYVAEHYRDVPVLGWWGPYTIAAGDALLYYSRLPGADETVRRAIEAGKTRQGRDLGAFYGQDDRDLYRAYMPDDQYHWGSNNIKANIGCINYDLVYYGLDADRSVSYRDRAAAALHYLHGVNPLNLVYLSNMGEYGAERSVDALYHGWFRKGGEWSSVADSPRGPAPGYVPGGPNKDYSGSRAGIKDQPVQKAYRDGNAFDRSWEITEPAIYYQSAYVKLLSKFVGAPAATAVEETKAALPAASASLETNYPNPFNGTTAVRYTVHRSGRIKVTVHTVQGQLLKVLADGDHQPGTYALEWRAGAEGGDVAAGVYLLRLEVEDDGRRTLARKMLYLK